MSAVRPERPGDADAIHSLLERAFDTGAEARLVDALRGTDAFLPDLALVAEEGDEVAGHLLMTRAHVRGEGYTAPVLALAPMAVAPERQRRGVGSSLVREALRRAEAMGERWVVVLGHPEYYPRFGFVPASRSGVRCPFEAPDEAFMIRPLGDRGERIDGVVEYAPPFYEL